MEAALSKKIEVADKTAARAETRLWSPVFLVVSVGAVLLINGLWRWYQQVEGLSSGLDATTPEFTQKWMPIWYMNLALGGVIQIGVPLGLWLTRDRHLDELAPAEELRRYLRLFTIMIPFALGTWISIMAGAADAGWHQIVVRDTSLTPSHIVLFFGTVPVFLAFGFGAFFYSMTRIPQYARKLSIAAALMFAGPFLVLPNVAYNEWGHAYWLMEELFIAPLHWGFAVNSWTFVASLAVVAQSLPRVVQLIKMTTEPEPSPAH